MALEQLDNSNISTHLGQNQDKVTVVILVLVKMKNHHFMGVMYGMVMKCLV